MNYEETQYGIIFIFGFFLIGGLTIFAYIYQWGNNPIPKQPFLILEGVFIIIFALFYKLVVNIENGIILIKYGIGLIKIKIKPESIIDAEELTVPWYYGLGIRITPQGMLYNLRGNKAVKITFQNKEVKKTVMIGTSDPKHLKRFLDRHFTVSKKHE